MAEQWWQSATTGILGVSRHHEDVVSFSASQLLDMLAPSNFLFTNPEVLRATLEQGGDNLARGMLDFLEDWQRIHSSETRRARLSCNRSSQFQSTLDWM